MSNTRNNLAWPPSLSKNQSDELTQYATTYALSHGLLYLPPGQTQPDAPSTAMHAPISLLPSPFPRRFFELAKRIQRTYNVLYARIAMDTAFMDSIMGGENGVGNVDDFVGQLWTGWKRLRDSGLLAQPLQLGLFRSDYLIHAPDNEPMSLKQVEFNTISSSFGALAQLTAEMHRHLYDATRYYHASASLMPANLPPNTTISGLVEGLAAAHLAYGVPESLVLFIVQPHERNVFDQLWIEYELLEKHSIRILRRTFDELIKTASLHPSTSALRISCSPDIDPVGFVEISTAYFRSGYVPHDYITPSHYTVRFLIEQSRAIKCPSIALQLAGCKVIQEGLTRPGILERFLCDADKYGPETFAPEDIAQLRGSFMEMWSLHVGEDLSSPDHDSIISGRESFGVRRARREALSLVLKPQREGGGNNVYKDDIPKFLDSLSSKERRAWIAMKLIDTPRGLANRLVRARNMESESKDQVETEVVNELGIFGWALFGDELGKIREKEIGWLMRTKGRDSNEGGVAAGFSVLDSVVLVDSLDVQVDWPSGQQ